MTRRNGVTLIEALMAIFVTAIGLLSLLVLFPLGAIKMAQAITDDRAAHAAANAWALAEARGLRNDTSVTPSYTSPTNGLPALTTAGYDGPSYPVYVDPSGTTLVGPTIGAFGASPGIPRTTVSYVMLPADLVKWFSLSDDLSYKTDDPNSGQVQTPLNRDTRFTFTYLARRPRNSVTSIVDLSVVVYKNRPQTSGGENAYSPVAFTAGASQLTLSWTATQDKPSIRKGSWIMDATVLAPDATGKLTQPEPHGYFYRVVEVTDTGGNTMLLDLEAPMKQSTPATGVNFPNGYGVLVVMENVVEVFEKGAGWKP